MPEGENKTPEQIAQEEQQKQEQEAQKQKEEEYNFKSKEDILKELKETKSEARDRRLKEKTHQTEIENLKSELKKIQDAELIKSGDTQKLLDQRNSELADLQKEIEELKLVKVEKEQQEEIFRKKLLTGLTKEQRDYLKDKPIAEIEKGRELFGVKTNIDTDLGTGINGNGTVNLSDKDKQKAEEMGLSPEGYKELKRREAVREKELQEKFSKLNKQLQ